MNEMVERVAKAIHRGDDEQWPWPTEGCNHCLGLARYAIEAMRDVPKICYDNYKCDKVWKDLNSTEVWNLWIDATLKNG